MASRIVSLVSDTGDRLDSLDGRPLCDGDTLMIRWPAGALQQVEVLVDQVPLGTLREGQVVTVMCSKAYFLLTQGRGAAKIYLNGFTAQRL